MRIPTEKTPTKTIKPRPWLSRNRAGFPSFFFSAIVLNLCQIWQKPRCRNATISKIKVKFLLGTSKFLKFHALEWSEHVNLNQRGSKLSFRSAATTQDRVRLTSRSNAPPWSPTKNITESREREREREERLGRKTGSQRLYWRRSPRSAWLFSILSHVFHSNRFSRSYQAIAVYWHPLRIRPG